MNYEKLELGYRRAEATILRSSNVRIGMEELISALFDLDNDIDFRRIGEIDYNRDFERVSKWIAELLGRSAISSLEIVDVCLVYLDDKSSGGSTSLIAGGWKAPIEGRDTREAGGEFKMHLKNAVRLDVPTDIEERIAESCDQSNENQADIRDANIEILYFAYSGLLLLSLIRERFGDLRDIGLRSIGKLYIRSGFPENVFLLGYYKDGIWKGTANFEDATAREGN